MSTTNLKIFTVYHKDYWKNEDEIFTPIQVGKNFSGLELDMISDNTGDNIADKNPNYCELTAQYWVWKNIKADYIGFCHYRRYFDFNENHQKFNEPISNIPDIDPEIMKQYGYYNNSKIYDLVENFDIVMPQRFVYEETIEEQYKDGHICEDWDVMEEVVLEKFPEYKPLMDKIFRGHEVYFLNMFIMKSEIYSNYMSWLFDILNEIEKRITVTEDDYQKRVFGFLSERLLTLYIAVLQSQQDIKIKELPVIMITPDTRLDAVTNDPMLDKNINSFITQYKGKIICLYGAGGLARRILRKYDLSPLNILGILDRNKNKIGEKLENYTIFAPEDIEKLNPDIICITMLESYKVKPYLEELKKSNNLKFKIADNLFILE